MLELTKQLAHLVWHDGLIGLIILQCIALLLGWTLVDTLPPGLQSSSVQQPPVRAILIGEETCLYDSVIMYHHARLLAWIKGVPLNRLFVLCKAELRWLLWWVPGLVFVDRSRASGTVDMLIRNTQDRTQPCILGIFPAGRRAFVPLAKWRRGAEVVWRESRLDAVTLGIDWSKHKSQLIAVRPSGDPYYKEHKLYDAVANDLAHLRPAIVHNTPVFRPKE